MIDFLTFNSNMLHSFVVVSSAAAMFSAVLSTSLISFMRESSMPFRAADLERDSQPTSNLQPLFLMVQI